MSLKSMIIICFIIILVSTSLFSVATAEDGYISETNAATASPEKSSTSGSNKNSDSNISTDLHLYASTLISIVLIICVTILLREFGHGIIFLLCFRMMMKSDDKKPIYIRQKKETIKFKVGGAENQTFLNSSEVANTEETLTVNEQQQKRKPKMSEPSSGKKETEELLQQSGAIQLLSQIYDMTKSLLNDTRELIKKFDQNEGTSKNSTECISTEVAALQKQKESQTLLPDNLSNGKDPESLKGIPACINDRNSHGSHSTNTLDSKADEQIKHNVDVPKEIPPLLKNNSLRRVTYDFNEIQSPIASNTNNGSNISTGTLFSIAFIIGLLFKSGNQATTDKKPIYIHNEKNIFQNTGELNGCLFGGGAKRNKFTIDKQTRMAPVPVTPPAQTSQPESAQNSKYFIPGL